MNLKGKVVFPQILAIMNNRTVTFHLEIFAVP